MSFVVPWAAWIAMNAAGLFGSIPYQGLSALLMFAPMLAALAAGRVCGTKAFRFSFKPRFKGFLRFYLFALLSPAAFTSLGAVLYFLCFPSEFSPPASLKPLQVAGLALACGTVAPVFNALFAIGEEAGWRGYPAPELERHFGPRASAALMGIIWGVWHTPVNIMG